MTKRITCTSCGGDNHFGNIACNKCGKGLCTL